MKPVVPIIPKENLPITYIAKNQSQYHTLPAFVYVDDGTVLTRWKFSFFERLIVLFFGDLYLWIRTFNRPLQPLSLQVKRPKCTNIIEQVNIDTKECVNS